VAASGICWSFVFGEILHAVNFKVIFVCGVALLDLFKSGSRCCNTARYTRSCDWRVQPASALLWEHETLVVGTRSGLLLMLPRGIGKV
jgi:hypothetical protein